MLYSDCSPIRLSAHSAASEDPTSRPSVCALDHCIFNIGFRCIKKQIGILAHSTVLRLLLKLCLCLLLRRNTSLSLRQGCNDKCIDKHGPSFPTLSKGLIKLKLSQSSLQNRPSVSSPPPTPCTVPYLSTTHL